MASLNTLQPENVAHGADITVQAQVTGGLPGFVTLAEVYEMDFDMDENLAKLPVFGSRRVGVRRGHMLVTGTLKNYWINQSVASMMAGLGNVTQAGSASTIYHSAAPFQRYNIVVSALSSSPGITLINVVFEKDAFKFTEASFSDVTVSFTAEDVLGNGQ